MTAYAIGWARARCEPLTRFRWEVTALGILALAGVIVVGGTSVAKAVMRANAAEQRVCDARLETFKLRNPHVRNWLAPADACRALDILAKEAR